ncbi:outer membrane beta-barrel protein [Sulfurimonas sp. SAG-AH-194-I05]|nr:outer membrane beta-barrel protein [Sulfurimonas sp. SAG-AH-194-I05]MDF1875734.1 outer membrane beta-barrel protein [Sulfurimonas sp. SAG-AH-194-I05]
MKKILASALLIASTSLFASNETKLLPIFDADYCPAPTIALMGGYGKYSGTTDGSTLYGLELGFGCPVFQIKDLTINQVLSLVHSSKNGLTTNALEMNPRIMFDISDKMQFGFGPGLGFIFADGEKSDTIFALNIGASLNYDITKDIFVGIEYRYQWAGDADILNSGVKTNLDNGRTLLKIGTHF